MAREFARRFYNSRAWKNTRKAYAEYVGGCCERCERNGLYGVPGEIVHHKIRLTPENITDPTIALDFSNLELLCRDCHAEVHEEDVYRVRSPRRYRVDEFGHVVGMEDSPLSS